MHFGIHVPNFGDFHDLRATAELAREAEDRGWDGFFLWDHVQYGKSAHHPTIDPWVALAAIAMRTERIRLGPLVTPIPRRRPWKLARETVSIDHLSGGRLILGVGLGFPPDAEFEWFGEEPDARVRAQKLDEGLDVLTGLWSGSPFEHIGTHYTVRKTRFRPTPVQRPRIPIWVAGYWGKRKAPFRRAARWDGVCAGTLKTPADVRAMMAYIRHYRDSDEPFDVVRFGDVPRVVSPGCTRDSIHGRRPESPGGSWGRADGEAHSRSYANASFRVPQEAAELPVTLVAGWSS